VLTLPEALAALPSHPDAIAARLGAYGIRGVRGDSCNCPVVHYLTGLGFDAVVVDEDTAVARAGGVTQSARTPHAVAEFILGFDGGAWPELVSDPETDDAPQ
jgi:hypothetical protein